MMKVDICRLTQIISLPEQIFLFKQMMKAKTQITPTTIQMKMKRLMTVTMVERVINV